MEKNPTNQRLKDKFRHLIAPSFWVI